MKSKTSLFNRTIFTNSLRRYWVLFAAYFAVTGASLLITLVNALQEQGWYPSNLPHYASLYELLQYAPSSMIVITFIAAPVAATLLFSFLYNARHTGMMTSLPVTRESMYLSVSAAGAAGFTICNAVILLLALIIELVYGDVSLTALGILFVIMTLTVLVFFGMAAFCCMLTGNIFAGPAVYLIFNFLTVGAEALVNNLLQDIVFGLGYGYTYKTMFLSPVLQIGNGLYFNVEIIRDDLGKAIEYTWTMEGMGMLVVYALVGLVFLGLGLMLYKRRRMEAAGDTIAIEILKPVFRLCMAVGGGLLFANFINEMLYQVTPTEAMAAVYIAVLLVVGGVLGYFIAQMLITKTVNVFRTGWKSVGLYALCVIGLVTAIEADLFGYEKKVPDAEDVESVYLTCYDGYNYIHFDELENIDTILQLHSNIIANKAFHEMENGSASYQAADIDLSEPGAEFRKQSIQLSYTLKDGSNMTRRYAVAYDPAAVRNEASEIRVLEALLNTDEAISERCITPFPVAIENVSSGWVEYTDAVTYEHLSFSDFAPSDIVRLYNECILPDIADGRLGVYDLIEDADYAKSKYNCTISLDLYAKAVTNDNGSETLEEYRNVVLYLTTDASRTLQFLKEHGINPATVYDSAVHDGYDYSDLGRYRVDGQEDVNYTMDLPAAAREIIGGADAPTDIVVTG